MELISYESTIATGMLIIAIFSLYRALKKDTKKKRDENPRVSDVS